MTAPTPNKPTSTPIAPNCLTAKNPSLTSHNKKHAVLAQTTPLPDATARTTLLGQPPRAINTPISEHQHISQINPLDHTPYQPGLQETLDRLSQSNWHQRNIFLQGLDGTALKTLIEQVRLQDNAQAQLAELFSQISQSQYNDLMASYAHPQREKDAIQKNLTAVSHNQMQAFFAQAPLKALWACNEACRATPSTLPCDKRTLHNIRRALFQAIHQEQFNLLMASYPPTHFSQTFIENLQLADVGKRHRYFLGLNGEQLKDALITLRSANKKNTTAGETDQIQAELFNAISQTQFNDMMLAFNRMPLSQDAVRQNLKAASPGQRQTFFASLSPGQLWSHNETLNSSPAASPAEHRAAQAIRQELFQSIDQQQFNGLMTHYPALLDPAAFADNLAQVNPGVRHNFFLSLHPYFLQESVNALRQLNTAQSQALQTDLFNAISQQQFKDLMAVYNHPTKSAQPLRINLMLANETQRKAFFASAATGTLWYYNEIFKRATPLSPSDQRAIKNLQHCLFDTIDQQQFNQLIACYPPATYPKDFMACLQFATPQTRLRFCRSLSPTQIANSLDALRRQNTTDTQHLVADILNTLNQNQFNDLIQLYHQQPNGQAAIRRTLSAFSQAQRHAVWRGAPTPILRACFDALLNQGDPLKNINPVERQHTQTLKKMLLNTISQAQFNELMPHYDFSKHPSAFIENLSLVDKQRAQLFFLQRDPTWQAQCLRFLEAQPGFEVNNLLRHLTAA